MIGPVILGILAGVMIALGVFTTTDKDSAAVATMACFPLEEWDAADADPPCVRITRVYEDGTFEFDTTGGR
jgi:hypothetical protein